MPYIIITNGVTGSGKSGLVLKTIAHYKLGSKYQQFLVDDLVTSNSFYKEGIDNYIRKECKSLTLCPSLREKLNDPNTQMYKTFGNLYFTTRGKTGQKLCNSNTQSCDDFLNDLLAQSIEKGDNIVFETTGSYYVKWLIDKLQGHNYYVYYSFTILDFCDNIRRNKTRAVSSTAVYLKNRRVNQAPRLPDVSEYSFRENVQKTGCNLFDLLQQRFFQTLSTLDHLIVFDNTTRKTVVIYDSDNADKSDFWNMIKRIKKVMNVRSCKRIT